jgi:hypothetical protein
MLDVSKLPDTREDRACHAIGLTAAILDDLFPCRPQNPNYPNYPNSQWNSRIMIMRPLRLRYSLL